MREQARRRRRDGDAAAHLQVLDAAPQPAIRVRTPDAEDAVIPLPTKARRSRELSPLWSEVAAVLARARPSIPDPGATDAADRKAA
jgi:hypothetical protein